MSNKLLEPTYKNLINHYVKDTIGRNEDLFYFVRMLSELNGGSAVALNGAWGSGKTFFVKQAKMLIDIHNPNSDIDVDSLSKDEIDSIKAIYEKHNVNSEKYEMPRMATVYYDAWKYDDTKDPLLSLLYCIMCRFGDSVPENKIALVKNFAKKSVPFLSQLAESITGIDVKQILEAIKNFADASEDTLKEEKKYESLNNRINKFLNNVVLDDEAKLIIFVDELDRCNPQYAVKLLERIKHYFNHEKIVFVISYNKMELQHSIKTLYGAEFSADKYLERFFDYEIGLRTIDVDKYFDTLGSNNRTLNTNMNAVVKIYNFQMREIWKYQDHMKKATAMIAKLKTNNIYSKEESLEFYITWFMPIVAGLHFHNINIYKEFIAGNGFQYYEEFFDLRLKSKDHHFGILLNGDERYNDNTNAGVLEGIKQTTLKSKFKQVYEAMFGNNIKKSEVEVGYVIVDSEVRKEFMNICNGISRLADYGEKVK